MALPKRLWKELKDKAIDTGEASVQISASPKDFKAIKQFFANSKKRDGGNTLGRLSYDKEPETSTITVTLSTPISHLAVLVSHKDDPTLVTYDVPSSSKNNTIPHEENKTKGVYPDDHK